MAVQLPFSENDSQWYWRVCSRRFHVTRIAKILAAKEFIFSFISFVPFIVNTIRDKTVGFELLHIVFGFITIFCVVFLFRGVNKLNHAMLLPYLIVVPIDIELLVLGIFYNCYKLSFMTPNDENVYSFVFMILQIVSYSGGIVLGVMAFMSARLSYLYIREKTVPSDSWKINNDGSSVNIVEKLKDKDAAMFYNSIEKGGY